MQGEIALEDSGYTILIELHTGSIQPVGALGYCACGVLGILGKQRLDSIDMRYAVAPKATARSRSASNTRRSLCKIAAPGS